MPPFQPMLEFEDDRAGRARPGAQLPSGRWIRKDDDEFAIGALDSTAVHLMVRCGDVLQTEKQSVLDPLFLPGDSGQRFHHPANERHWKLAQIEMCPETLCRSRNQGAKLPVFIAPGTDAYRPKTQHLPPKDRHISARHLLAC